MDTVDVGRRIANCSSRIEVEVLLHPENEPEAALTGAKLCNARLCPFCEWRRARAWRKRLISGLEAFHLDYPKWKPIFLTLTVKNVPLSELRNEIKRMNDAWTRLKKTANYPTDKWFRRTEVVISAGRRPTGSVGEAYQAHPHFHCLLLVPPRYFSADYISQKKWAEMWQMALRENYAPVVDVRRAKSKWTSGQTPMPESTAASLEAAKYATKATNLLELGDSISEFHHQMAGLRLYAVSKGLKEYIDSADMSEKDMLDAPTQTITSEVDVVKATATWFEDSQEYLFTNVA